MKRLIAIALRLVWMSFAYLIAVYVAGAVTTLAVDSMWPLPDGRTFDSFVALVDMALYIGVTGAFIGQAFFYPAIAAMAAAEIFQIRGALSHLLGGAGVATASGMLYDVVRRTHVVEARAWEMLLAAGVLAGAVYWVLAGRNAGRWKDVGAAPPPLTNTTVEN